MLSIVLYMIPVRSTSRVCREHLGRVARCLETFLTITQDKIILYSMAVVSLLPVCIQYRTLSFLSQRDFLPQLQDAVFYIVSCVAGTAWMDHIHYLPHPLRYWPPQPGPLVTFSLPHLETKGHSEVK
ncbi:hypothetical protein ElyMa_004164900 [Elysia marginata]|uniref:Uncharacterized protein n=1 Tax=Elysia marginata TaxID=1093978 RepID=A0AAV4GIF9_9GAST|nr:hypothetical protein ElyMa_004164900 [Elysia marginata]